jgi:hypothetical protein
MHRRTDHGFDRFEIEPALVAFPKNEVQKTIYFAGDLAPDLVRFFFSALFVPSVRWAANGRSAY